MHISQTTLDCAKNVASCQEISKPWSHSPGALSAVESVICKN